MRFQVSFRCIMTALVVMSVFVSVPLGAVAESTVESLRQDLKSSDAQVRLTALRALGGHLDDQAALKAVTAAIKDKDPSVRAKAAETLKGSKDRAAIAALTAALKDKDVTVRRAAVTALAAAPDAKTIQPLLAAMKKEQDAAIRQMMKTTFGRITDPKAADPLISLLRSDDGEVRAMAAMALGNLNDQKAQKPLLKTLTDWYAASAAAKSLVKLGWKPEGEKDEMHVLAAERNQMRLNQSWQTARGVFMADVLSRDPRTIENALYVFIALGKDEVIPDLIKTLNRSGNKHMGEAFLNSGHSELDKAAEAWGKKRGMTVRRNSGKGNRPVRWGSFDPAVMIFFPNKQGI